jgi:hypothetical protein
MSFETGFTRFRANIFAVIVVTFAASANAALIIDSGSGRLRGATDVSVLGVSYDVEFLDGLCGDLFSGCNEPLDFAFSDLSSVRAAGQALLDQVLIDSSGYLFDSDPSTVASCAFSSMCNLWTPFTRLGPIQEDGSQDRLMLYDIVQNHGITSWDEDAVIGTPGGVLVNPGTHNGTNGVSTWARWTQSRTSVPEPSTFVIFASALAAMFLTRRRRQDHKPAHAAMTSCS